ncbi:MAG TPA: SusD/RagB family nutrient-binding outer membrane lipoprotein [Chitinophagaceae bacterium]
MKRCQLFPFLIALLVFSSCKKDFMELNKNPNTLERALPKTLLAPALTEIVKFNAKQAESFGNELMQVHIDMGGSNAKPYRYDIPTSLAIAPYNSWFLQIPNFRDIYSGALYRLGIDSLGHNKTYMAISLICEAWVMSLITDTYGDVPFTEAGQAKEQKFLPKFDSQESIYLGLFAKLEEANTLLKTNADFPVDEQAADPLYKGVALKWRKFGNSLYLRLLLRASAKSVSNAPAKISAIVLNTTDYPLIDNNDASAILRWTGTVPYDSPFATTKTAAWNTRGYTNFFINNLKLWNDPRLAKWVKKDANNQYTGVPSGFLPSDNPPKGSSRPNTLQTEPLLGNMLNYSEVQFMLAEAAARGWITGAAKTYYENGITSHMTLWGLTLPTGYLSSAPIAWKDTDNLEAKLEKIHLQKYYSLFFTDFQSWFEYRRTGHPILPQGNGLLNNGLMPARLMYPVYLQSSNGANLRDAITRQGPDDINTKVWWQKP